MLAIEEFEAEIIIPQHFILISCYVNFIELLLKVYHILKGLEGQKLSLLFGFKSYSKIEVLNNLLRKVSLSIYLLVVARAALEQNKMIRLQGEKSN